MPPVNASPMIGSNLLKDSLVDQIKNIQRSSQGAKEAWYNFVVQTQNSSKKDPNAHSEEDLQRFIEGYNSGEIVPLEPANTGSTYLVDQVKLIQREGGKDAWYAFVRNTTNPDKKDPAAHTDEELQAFLDKYKSGELGIVTAMNQMMSEPSSGSKDLLVQQVKGYQKANQEQKAKWYEFVKSTKQPGSKDPARHSEEDLERFVRVINGDESAMLPDPSSGGSWQGNGGGGDMMQMMMPMMAMMAGSGGGGGGGKQQMLAMMAAMMMQDEDMMAAMPMMMQMMGKGSGRRSTPYSE